jgi:hypothetical protein
MEADPEEPVLPYTPSNTGRRSRVGYLGFDGVGFNDLWPVFAGLVLSIALALRFFVAERSGAHWPGRTILACLPFATGFCYLRFLVVGRPPHFKGDLWAGALGLTMDFTGPPRSGLRLLPRIFIDPAAASGPGRAADLRHPMDSAGTPGRTR